MKPRIRRCGGLWRCERDGDGRAGFGYTPGDAFAHWRVMLVLCAMGGIAAWQL